MKRQQPIKSVYLQLAIFIVFLFSNDYMAGQTLDTFTYLALGDSYTIGESVPESERWPVQLVNEINIKSTRINAPNIIAKTGWRTGDLLNAIDKEPDDKRYDIVSVLIGVNNQFQGKSIFQYTTDLRTLFKKAISLCKKGEKGVFALSIPDYGVTPFGKDQKERIQKEIDQWNLVYENISEEFNISFYNITEISRQAEQEPDLIAFDKLHPSGKMYLLWVKHIIKDVEYKLVQ
jgi:lysophospholipase L1-like esterase